MSSFRHPLFVGLVSAVVATLITLKAVGTSDEVQALAPPPDDYDKACQQARYEMAIGYDNRINWAIQVLCGDGDKGLGLVTFNGHGVITKNVGLYGVERMPVNGSYETPITFVTTRFGGPANTIIGEEILRRVPEDCKVIGYTEVYAYSEPGWSGVVMTNAKPLVTCNGDARIIGGNGNETLVRNFQWL